MPTENSGSSQYKKQEDPKKISEAGHGTSPDLGGNEYTAAFILYCQKTLDNFRRMYASDTVLGLGPGFGPGFGYGPNSGLAPSPMTPTTPGPKWEPEDKFNLGRGFPPPLNDNDEKDALGDFSKEFERMFGSEMNFGDDDDDDDELDEGYETDLDDEKERDALRELSEQFERMLKEKDDDFKFGESDKMEFGDEKERDALGELSQHFAQMFGSGTNFEDNSKLGEDSAAKAEDDKKEETLEDFFAQFQQMLEAEAKSGNKPLELEQTAPQSQDHKGGESIQDLLKQFEQMLNDEIDPDSNKFALEQHDQSQSNGHQEDDGLKEFLEQFEQDQRMDQGAGALHSIGSNAPGEEKALPPVTQPSTPSRNNGPDDANVDEALSGVGAVVKSAKENLGIVEAFWEESELERVKLLAKAGITQEDFEQLVTRTGAHLYDVKDCLEGWGDLSMLPETYEQLLLANNELTEIFEKMYGKEALEILSKNFDDDDDWELDDDD
jgi:hypothetical protein